jgi:hypothetical protein
MKAWLTTIQVSIGLAWAAGLVWIAHRYSIWDSGTGSVFVIAIWAVLLSGPALVLVGVALANLGNRLLATIGAYVGRIGAGILSGQIVLLIATHVGTGHRSSTEEITGTMVLLGLALVTAILSNITADRIHARVRRGG